MRIELIQDGLEGLADEWRELHEVDPLATPFVSPGWVLPCWRHYAGDAKPWVLAARRGDKLVGLVPLAIRRVRGIRTLQVIAEALGDYWDVLAHPAERGAVLEAVTRELRRRAGEWDALSLARLPGKSGTRAALERSGTHTRRGPGLPCPGLELPASFEDYLRALPRDRRWHVRRDLRRLDEGEVTLRTVVDPEELGVAVGRWHELRLRQWSEQGRELFWLQAENRFRDFIADVVHVLVPAKRALVWEFWAGERLVGSYVSFMDKRSFYPYLGGYEPSAAALGIGKIAIAEGIRSSVAAGRTYYDFMIGDEPYKYQYGAQDRRVEQLSVRSPSPRALVAVALRRITAAVRPAARRAAHLYGPTRPRP